LSRPLEPMVGEEKKGEKEGLKGKEKGEKGPPSIVLISLLRRYEARVRKRKREKERGRKLAKKKREGEGPTPASFRPYVGRRAQQEKRGKNRQEGRRGNTPLRLQGESFPSKERRKKGPCKKRSWQSRSYFVLPCDPGKKGREKGGAEEKILRGEREKKKRLVTVLTVLLTRFAFRPPATGCPKRKKEEKGGEENYTKIGKEGRSNPSADLPLACRTATYQRKKKEGGEKNSKRKEIVILLLSLPWARVRERGKEEEETKGKEMEKKEKRGGEKTLGL